MAIEKNGTEVIKRDLRYTFSNTELLEIGKRLAEGARRLGELDKEKKRITSDYTARMNAVESEVNILSAAISSGYDIRPIECHVQLHLPKAGEKTIVRLDTFETVGVEQMTGDEMQTMLKFEAEAKASEVAAAVKTSATEFPTEAKGAAAADAETCPLALKEDSTRAAGNDNERETAAVEEPPRVVAADEVLGREEIIVSLIPGRRGSGRRDRAVFEFVRTRSHWGYSLAVDFKNAGFALPLTMDRETAFTGLGVALIVAAGRAGKWLKANGCENPQICDDLRDELEKRLSELPAGAFDGHWDGKMD